MPSKNVFQYSKIRTRKRSAKKSLKTGKKMESSSFWNPESTVLESGIQYPESGIHSMESRIQDCPGFPYMGQLSSRVEAWLEVKKNIAALVALLTNKSRRALDMAVSFLNQRGKENNTLNILVNGKQRLQLEKNPRK